MLKLLENCHIIFDFGQSWHKKVCYNSRFQNTFGNGHTDLPEYYKTKGKFQLQFLWWAVINI